MRHTSQYKKLRPRAIGAASHHSHTLGRFHVHGVYLHMHSAVCKHCGKEVTINSNPEPNGIDIGGAAAATACDGLFIQGLVRGYIDAMLWASTMSAAECKRLKDMDDTCFDAHFSREDLTPKALAFVLGQCRMFADRCADKGIDLGSIGAKSVEHIGHDIFLTSAHHGAGFWDGDYAYPLSETDERDTGETLTAIAHTLKEYGSHFSAYVNGRRVDID